MKRYIKLISLLLILTALLATGVSALHWQDGTYVNDQAGLLTQTERNGIESYASRISEKFGCDIYIMTVWDYTDLGYGYDVFDTAWQIYHSSLLGYGSDNSGVLLLLSMEQRDYALFVNGYAEFAFNSHGQTMLEDAFLDDFRYDHWFDGFYDYLNTAEELLLIASSGEPVGSSPSPRTGLFILVGIILSAVITAIFWAQMRSVKWNSGAHAYVTDSGLKLTGRTDLFLRQTRTVRRIQKSSGPSGSHGGGGSGGGGSGRSGKF